jgi:ubiquinone/menaquinone biosynthesis C-methylase UbiE
VEEWAEALAAWAIPDEILARAPESPWQLPRELFARRADLQIERREGSSIARAEEALGVAGSVLDVGAGAGAGSLPLRGMTELVAVDTQPEMLEELLTRANKRGLSTTAVVGQWPEVAPRTPAADVVVCHHVLYNVADLAPFVTALSAYARHRVVVEMSAKHPMTPWNPLWQRFHGLDRPQTPTATDAVEAIAALGFDPQVTQWERPATLDAVSYAELVTTTCRRLCLGPEKASDVDAALRDLGADPTAPTLGGPTRSLATIWWAGTTI